MDSNHLRSDYESDGSTLSRSRNAFFHSALIFPRSCLYFRFRDQPFCLVFVIIEVIAPTHVPSEGVASGEHTTFWWRCGESNPGPNNVSHNVYEIYSTMQIPAGWTPFI